jgi:hypothetical protein
MLQVKRRREPKSVVAPTVVPANGGTHRHMEQSGFRPDRGINDRGAGDGGQNGLTTTSTTITTISSAGISFTTR